MDDRKTKVFFSSSWQTLVSLLERSLFEDGRPFARRCVIVPSEAMKDSVMHRLAEGEEGIAFGVEFMTLPSFLNKALATCQKKLPTRLELSLALEGIVIDLLDRAESDQELCFLRRFLDKKVLDPKVLRERVIALCEELSSLFYEKSLQPEEEIQSFISSATWQAKLWQKVFAGNRFTPLYALCHGLRPLWDSVHVFGLLFIPIKVLELINRLPLYLYTFSPTEYFWEDLCSDKERLFLQRVLEGKKARLKVQQQMMLYLKEDNPLLGSWGKAGKALLKVLAPYEPFFEEYYDRASDEGSLLSEVQKDFLLLAQEPSSSVISEEDRSIQVHACPSLHREVEVVLEVVLKAMQQAEKEGGSLSGADILVVVLGLSKYVPYIHEVFTAGQLPYRILDIPSVDSNSLTQAFEHFFSMVGSRMELSSVWELLSFSPLQRKYDLDKEQMAAICRLFDAAGIDWGYNNHHRQQQLSVLQGKVIANLERGSWEHGLDYLLKTLIAKDEDAFAGVTLASVGAEVLGKIVFIIRSIYDDLTMLQALSAPFNEAKQTITTILARHFDGVEKSPFFAILESMAHNFEEIEAPFTFTSFARVLSFAALKNRSSFQRGCLSAVTFCAFEPGMLFDAPVVIVVGADEMNLPRKEVISPLLRDGLLSSINAPPAKEDVDRFLFMQALMAARKVFAITYNNISPQDGKPQGPSVLVQDLLAYMKNRYHLQGLCHYHSSHYYSDSNFSAKSSFIPVSFRAHQAAKAAYTFTKKPSAPMFSFAEDADALSDNTLQHVAVKDLFHFAKNPMRHLLQQRGIYLSPLFEKQQQSFILSPLTRYEIHKQARGQSAKHISDHLKDRSLLPIGPFEALAMSQVNQIIEEQKQTLDRLGIEKESFFTLSLTDHLTMSFRDSNVLFVPAAVVRRGSYECRFTGDIEGGCNLGIVFDAKDSLEELIKLWPAYLLFLISAENACLAGRDLILLKTGTRLSPADFNPTEALGRFLDFYDSCMKHDFVCQPTWHKPLAESDSACYARAFSDKELFATNRFSDPYLRFVYLKDRPIPFSRMHGLWQRFCHPFYQDVQAMFKDRS